jgi:hypothetical protein
MESFIVVGAVAAFLLLMLPAVIAPFLPRNPSQRSSISRLPSGASDSRPVPPLDAPNGPSERIAA